MEAKAVCHCLQVVLEPGQFREPYLAPEGCPGVTLPTFNGVKHSLRHSRLRQYGIQRCIVQSLRYRLRLVPPQLLQWFGVRDRAQAVRARPFKLFFNMKQESGKCTQVLCLSPPWGLVSSHRLAHGAGQRSKRSSYNGTDHSLNR
jgi:hypothetical protein